MSTTPPIRDETDNNDEVSRGRSKQHRRAPDKRMGVSRWGGRCERSDAPAQHGRGIADAAGASLC